MKPYAYRYEATSVAGFVQQLSVCYIRNEYWFYVLGHIPEEKDAAEIDRKLVDRYDVAVSKWVKARRRQLGEAKVQYLRHEETFVLLSTAGRHLFFELEGNAIKDVRECPISFHGYSIGYRGGHPHVRIGDGTFRRLRDELDEVALALSVEELAGRLRGLPFEPYGPVKEQFRKLLRRVNRARRAAGLDRVPDECLRLRRKSVRPFESTSVADGRWGPQSHAGRAA